MIAAPKTGVVDGQYNPDPILAKLKLAATTPTPVAVAPIDQGIHAPTPAPSSPTPADPTPRIFNSLPAPTSAVGDPMVNSSEVWSPNTGTGDPLPSAPVVDNPVAPPPPAPAPPPPQFFPGGVQPDPFGSGIGDPNPVAPVVPPPAPAPAAVPPTGDPAPAPPSGEPAAPPAAAVPPGATAPDAAANDTAAAEERMRRILALNEETKAVEVPTSGFDDENNLVGEQISPNDSGRLQQRGELADTQLSAIALSDRNAAAANHAGEAIDPVVGERLAKLRALQDSTLDKAANGPDRVQMGIDQLARFTKDSTPDYDLQRRKALNDAAAFGYTGSGRLNTQYGDLDLQRERDMDSQKERLSQAALEGTIGDRQNLLNTLGQFGNDEATYEQQSRDEQRKERSWRTDQGDADVAAEYKKGDYLTGAEKDQRGVEQGQRDEQRGERAYQRSLSETALTQQMDAAKLKDQLTQSEFERDQERLNAGYAKDPGDEYEAAAQQAFNEGKLSADELKAIMEYIAQQKKQSSTTDDSTTSTDPVTHQGGL